MRTLIAGEGPTELGSLSNDPAYRFGSDGKPKSDGVILALLNQVAPGHFEVEDGLLWKHIRKYRAGRHRGAEQRNVMGLALYATERGFAAAVFARDRDRSSQRAEELELGLREANETFGVPIAGGVAEEALEAWLLALLDDTDAEKHENPKSVLAGRGIETVAAKVELVIQRGGGLMQGQKCAPSLEIWVDRVRELVASL